MVTLYDYEGDMRQSRCRKFNQDGQRVHVVDYDGKGDVVEGNIADASRRFEALKFLSRLEPGKVYAITEVEDSQSRATIIFYVWNDKDPALSLLL